MSETVRGGAAQLGQAFFSSGADTLAFFTDNVVTNLFDFVPDYGAQSLQLTLAVSADQPGAGIYGSFNMADVVSGSLNVLRSGGIDHHALAGVAL